MKKKEGNELMNQEQRPKNENEGRKKSRQALSIINVAVLLFGGYTVFTNITYLKKITSSYTVVNFDDRVKLNFLGADINYNKTNKKQTHQKNPDNEVKLLRAIENNKLMKNEVEPLSSSDASSLPPTEQISLHKKGNFTKTIKVNSYNESIIELWSSEKSVFRNMLKRAETNFESCSEVRKLENWNEAFSGKFTNMSYLPKFGIVKALSDHLSGKNKDSASYPYKCSLPPPKSCNETGYSVVLLTHDTSNESRLRMLLNGINDLKSRPLTKEIILVWNGKREDLKEERLLNWDKDDSHPLRIFFHQLGNDLFNRWHPDINPKMDAVLYFDDDGPFFDETAVNAGFDLWKRNSDVPVAAYYRNFRFKSSYQVKHMQVPMQTQMNLAVEQIEQGWQNLSPYDTSSFSSVQSTHSNAKHPSFIPFCSTSKRDLEYNFYVFPSFGSHMFLPSGVILHKNFLCWLWHPVFQHVRDYLKHHPTHADDVTVSTLTNQVTGKSFRVYPRRLNKADENSDQSRRKLLWEKKNWPDLRTEAINSITGYFGSLSPGSAGWCIGTKFLKRKDRRKKWLDQSCAEEFPKTNEIPWSIDGGLGFDQC